MDDGQAVRNLINDLNDVGDAAQNAADDIGEIAQATKGAALMEAADQLSVVGDKIQDVGDKAVNAYAETETAVSKVNAYFGETGEAAEASAEIVKNVYGSVWARAWTLWRKRSSWLRITWVIWEIPT